MRRLSMDAEAYAMMARTEDRHWWWSGRRTILREILGGLFRSGTLPPGALYDLGCGVGSNLPVLESFGPTVGYDGSDLAVEAAHRLGRMNVRHADLARGVTALEGLCEPASASVVLLADVLEHLADERPAMELASWLLAPGGALVVTVPAFPLLWGPADEFNHHHRRYTEKTLRPVIADFFVVERMTYFNFFLFAPIALARTVTKFARRPGHEEVELPPWPVNMALGALFGAESRLLGRRDLPFGVSLLCVGRKPGA